MMAMTQNDEVNSLAVRECRPLFGRAHLYQLSFNSDNLHHRRGLTENLMGRELFEKGLTFSKFTEMHDVGARFKATTLSEEFSYENYTATYQNGSTLLCLIDESNALVMNTAAEPLVPMPGHTIIAMVAGTALPTST